MAPKAKAKAGAKKQAARPMPEASPAGKSATDIAGVFRSWDTAGNGKISLDELKAVLNKTGGIAEEDMETIFEGADLNKDGFIDYDEFLAWLFHSAPENVQRFARDVDTPPKDQAAAQKKLDDMLVEVFKCFDQDEDGQLERVELLDVTEKLYKAMNDLFGVKDRKGCVQWFKDAGAEGDASNGMYLSFDKWKLAYLTQMKQKAGCTADEPAILADYLYKNVAEPLFKITYPNAASASATAAEAGGAPVDVPPTYPITIDFKQLKEAVETARRFERSALILTCGKEAVDTFFQYQNMIVLDCKQIIAEVYVKKNKSKEDWQNDVADKLKMAMNSSGFCKAVLVALQNSAFDFNGFCGEKVPADVFSPGCWTPNEAMQRGFIDDGHKMNVEIEDCKKWKDFHMVITSSFDLEAANSHLPDKLPHWDELAIIVVDPKSIDAD